MFKRKTVHRVLVSYLCSALSSHQDEYRGRIGRNAAQDNEGTGRHAVKTADERVREDERGGTDESIKGKMTKCGRWEQGEGRETEGGGGINAVDSWAGVTEGQAQEVKVTLSSADAATETLINSNVTLRKQTVDLTFPPLPCFSKPPIPCSPAALCHLFSLSPTLLPVKLS